MMSAVGPCGLYGVASVLVLWDYCSIGFRFSPPTEHDSCFHILEAIIAHRAKTSRKSKTFLSPTYICD